MLTTTTFAITTFIELLVSGLLIYGFMHEDKVIAFEQAVRRIVLGHIRRAIRIRRQKKFLKDHPYVKGGVIPGGIPCEIVITENKDSSYLSYSDIIPVGDSFHIRKESVSKYGT